MRWDPQLYLRHADARGRPFLDLVARIGADAPHRVVDLGCGPGGLTALLCSRWPSAVVHGVDSSPEMIARAGKIDVPRLSFEVADIATWSLPADVDVVVSNATLQWVPKHREVLARWAYALRPGGWLAVQVPGNFDAPSHRLMRELASSPRWDGELHGVLRHSDAVAEPAEYEALLADAGLDTDVWETTYLHMLPGPDPVLGWVRGTGLRPVLAALTTERAAQFETEYAALLRDAYPSGPRGTPFPFRRIFAVAHRSA